MNFYSYKNKATLNFNNYKFILLFSICFIPYFLIIDRYQIRINIDSLNDISYDVLLNSSNHKYVALSVNLNSFATNYIFNLPYVTLAWRRVGYEPIVLLINSSNVKSNPLSNKCLEYLNKFNIKIVNVEAPANYEILVGMLSRLFIGLLPDFVQDNDFIITSDIDLIPINKDFYNILNKNDLVVWNAYCCGVFRYKNLDYTMYPLSYIGMRKFQWKEVMNLTLTKYVLNGEFIIEKITELFDKNVYVKRNDEIKKGESEWYRKYICKHKNSLF